MKYLIVLFFIIGVAHAQSSKEDISVGNGFLQRCSVVEKLDNEFSQSTYEEKEDGFFCVGYVRGLSDGLDNANIIGGNRALCLPEGVTNGQMTRVLLKNIRENPENAHEHTSLLLSEALKRAYPCAKSK